MAKGDKKKHQTAIDTEGKKFDTGMANVDTTLGGTQNQFMGDYRQGVGKNMGSYDEIMQGYRDIQDDIRSGRGGRGKFQGGNYTPQTYDYTDPFKSYGGYSDFASTGGLSAADQQNMRERGIAPTRAIYQNAMRGINRSKALQGGYAPNAIAALAKNKREMSQGISDANIAVNSDIAKMVQSGKLAGLGGMSGIESQRLGAEIDKNKFTATQKNWAQEQEGADRRFGYQFNDPYNNRLQALQGMTSLYGATPGMAQLFGNQVLQNQNQMLDAQRMRGDWGQNQQNQQFQNSQIKGNFGQAMDNINSFMQPVSQIGGMVTGFGNMFPGGRGGGSRGFTPGPSGPTGNPYTSLFQPSQGFNQAVGAQQQPRRPMYSFGGS